VIAWVDAAAKSWGRCTRWILCDTGEGYPTRDTIAKARDGLLSAREAGAAAQHFREVRAGDALDVARAMRGEPETGLAPMPLELTVTMFAQYVAVAKTAKRVEVVGDYLRVDISRADYWRNVDRAHYFLAGRMPVSSAVALFPSITQPDRDLRTSNGGR
jgi:hypothetical protein